MSARVMGWVEGAGRLDAPIGTLARVGAMPDNDIVVRLDGVSRTHARIVSEPDGYWVEDVNSRNGTWLNGERIKRARLRHLDVITLGRYAEMVFVEREGAEAPVPSTITGVRVRVEWLDGPRRGDVIDIPTGETLFGRAESCAVVVDTPAVSRAHARISNSAGRVTIEDLGSANGTKVKGQLIASPVALSNGDEVQLGDARKFKVVIDGVAGAASVPTQLGGTPSRSQDMEWATRLVFSAEDLEAISRAAGNIDKPSPPPSRPVGKAPQAPVAPVPSPQVPPARANVVPADATTLDAGRERPSAPRVDADRTSADRPNLTVDSTRLGGADLRVPTALGAPAPSAEPPSTQLTGIPGAPFTPPKFSPDGAAADRGTGMDRTMFDGGASNNLPPSVNPPERPTESRVAGVQLTGESGTFVLAPGTSTIGRSADATLRIDSRELSRIHAAITIAEREVTIEDRGSVNGTTVNGTRIAGPTVLASGDRVAFANVEFRVDVQWTEGK